MIEATVEFTDESGAKAGAKRIRLLEAIGELGSISAAAKSVGLSYKAAWDAVHALNNLFPHPVVTARAGGSRGGTAELTAEGRQVVAAYGLLTGELARFATGLSKGLAAPGVPDISTLLWSIFMRTSARNALRGTISSVTLGAVNSEVHLALSETTELVAIITNRSVEDLGLTPGKPAFALVKSSFIILAPEAETARTSARNRICGSVVHCEPGAVNSEVILDIGDGKTLTAIVTKDSAETLDLSPGRRVCALIKASHVILGVD